MQLQVSSLMSWHEQGCVHVKMDWEMGSTISRLLPVTQAFDLTWFVIQVTS